MNFTQINSFIDAANKLQPGSYIEETSQGFQTTSDSSKSLSTKRIQEIATQCLNSLAKEHKSYETLIKGLKNIETTLKETHCFDTIYAVVPKLPLGKLPNVILTQIFGYEMPQELAQIEQTAKKFKNRLAQDKVWEKEAKKLGLEVPPEQSKDAVLERYHFLPQVIELLCRSMSGDDKKEVMAIDKPLDRLAALEYKLETIYGTNVIRQYLRDLTENTMDEKSLLTRMHAILWAIKSGLCTREFMLYHFEEFTIIENLDIQKKILIAIIKHLPRLEKDDTRTLNRFLMSDPKYCPIELTIRLVDKFNHISSQGFKWSIIGMAYMQYPNQLEEFKALARTLIQKGDRLVNGDVHIPEDIRKFIDAEVAAAEKAKH